MADALIGYTGFVGSTLLRHRDFDARFNSKNIEQIAGQTFDLVVCAGAPAEKWKANRDPDTDRAAIDRLCAALDGVRARRFVLISTVDVYPEPRDVDESTEIDRAAGHAYGRHRLLLEDVVRARFDACVVRLPALFGHGLKKNALYDLLHDNEVEKIDPASVFQFYDMRRLHDDVGRALAGGLPLVNLVPEPTSMGDVARHAFGRTLPSVDRPPARYDVRTRHAEIFGGAPPYIAGAADVLDDIASFVARERQRA